MMVDSFDVRDDFEPICAFGQTSDEQAIHLTPYLPPVPYQQAKDNLKITRHAPLPVIISSITSIHRHNKKKNLFSFYSPPPYPITRNRYPSMTQQNEKLKGEQKIENGAQSYEILSDFDVVGSKYRVQNSLTNVSRGGRGMTPE